jgi:uncharacterized protein (DUF1330 family)
MSAYWIGRTRVRDREGMKRYGELVQRAAALYKPEALVRGGPGVVLEGSADLDRHVLLRFSSVEQALRYYHSPEYQEAAAIRHASSDQSELVIVEGLD